MKLRILRENLETRSAPGGQMSESDFYESLPFGTPEGARAALDDFVGFEGQPRFRGLATRADDLTARIFVGAKGSGKTFFIRRQRATAAKDPSLYVDEVQRTFPTTREILDFSSACALREQTSMWRLIWKLATLRSVATHLLYAETLSNELDEEYKRLLLKDYGSFIGGARSPTNVYSQASSILRYGSPDTVRFRDYLNDSGWDELEYRVAQGIDKSRPVCLFLDAIDEDFSEAPQQWLKCQEGLFLHTLDYLGNPRLGGRLHLTVGVRDVVYSSLLRTEHANRYRGEHHIRLLAWNREAIRHLLMTKIAGLSDIYMARPDEPPSVVSWLGVESVDNKAFKISELVEDYLLRHTRSSPRDVVQLGNLLCDRLVQSERGSKDLAEVDVRDTVAVYAEASASEQIVIAGAQVLADQMPKDAARHQYSDSFIGDAPYDRGMSGKIRDLIRRHLADRFDLAALNNFKTDAKALLGDATDLPTILWQTGLLGYQSFSADLPRAVFYSAGAEQSFLLPGHKTTYFLHPSIFDTMNDLKLVGTEPVTPVIGGS